MRLGTYYRSLMLNKLDITANKNLVLDVGSFDGYWLSQQTQAKAKIAIDMKLSNKFKNIIYIKADALNLPFKDNTFDQVFGFDVIEHVENESRFLKELCRVCKVSSEVIISTPHKLIKIFPPFLTDWVSKKWGHLRSNGYLDTEIKDIMPKEVVCEILYLREPFYRGFYFMLRLLWEINEKFAKCIVKYIVHMDFLFLCGKGVLLIKMQKKKDSE